MWRDFVGRENVKFVHLVEIHGLLSYSLVAIWGTRCRRDPSLIELETFFKSIWKMDNKLRRRGCEWATTMNQKWLSDDAAHTLAELAMSCSNVINWNYNCLGPLRKDSIAKVFKSFECKDQLWLLQLILLSLVVCGKLNLTSNMITKSPEWKIWDHFTALKPDGGLNFISTSESQSGWQNTLQVKNVIFMIQNVTALVVPHIVCLSWAMARSTSSAWVLPCSQEHSSNRENKELPYSRLGVQYHHPWQHFPSFVVRSLFHKHSIWRGDW